MSERTRKRPIFETMTVERLRNRLADYEPTLVRRPNEASAAVALVLRPSASLLDVLLIRRAEREGDPWSGHMALPGGRSDRGDTDLVGTAIRETREEVGIDLGESGELIGALDELRAVARRRPLDLVISPFVFNLKRDVELLLAPHEVEAAMWIPLTFFAEPAARSVHKGRYNGTDIDFPAFDYRGHTIWGLTHRVLEHFFEVTKEAIG
jgi:8-oxo-dGTP pyrophosphatase MutT (NUDIX family)